jgi:uncharacterized membrane protein
MFQETKKRTLVKVITWRVVAVLNSYLTLIIFSATGDFGKALIMNLTGFFAFYIFERIWNVVNWGKVSKV